MQLFALKTRWRYVKLVIVKPVKLLKKAKKTKKNFHYSLKGLSICILFLVLLSALLYTKTVLLKKIIPHRTITTTVVQNTISDKMTAAEYMQIKQKLLKTVTTKNPQAALSELESLTNIDPKVIQYCHGLSHEIGHAAYKKYGFAGALAYQSSLCGSGYVHGIIESYFEKTTDLTSKLHSVCQVGTLSYESGNCYHGIGHGLMFYTDNNIPLSLTYCDSFSDVTKRSLCAEGVFMENFNADVTFHPTNYLNPKNPFYPCLQQTTFYKDACYFYATDYYLQLHAQDYTNAIKWCNGAEEGFVATCDRGVGSRAMKYHTGTPSFVEKICMTADTQEKRDACIDGMISYFLVQYNSTSRAKSICSGLTVVNQTACFRGIANRSVHFLN